jgi:hypothetical protein
MARATAYLLAVIIGVAALPLTPLRARVAGLNDRSPESRTEATGEPAQNPGQATRPETGAAGGTAKNQAPVAPIARRDFTGVPQSVTTESYTLQVDPALSLLPYAEVIDHATGVSFVVQPGALGGLGGTARASLVTSKGELLILADSTDGTRGELYGVTVAATARGAKGSWEWAGLQKYVGSERLWGGVDIVEVPTKADLLATVTDQGTVSIVCCDQRQVLEPNDRLANLTLRGSVGLIPTLTSEGDGFGLLITAGAAAEVQGYLVFDGQASNTDAVVLRDGEWVKLD